MDSLLANIPARSEREAMDWSLVLASQGIETTIAHPEPGAAWELVVASHDYEPGLEAIRKYQAENRGWPWQQRVFHGEFLFDWASLTWALLLLFFYWLDKRAGLVSDGLMDSAKVAHGEWWRLFTAIWLHGDFGHLAANATIGFLLLALTMGRYGTGRGLLAAYLAGAGGNLLAGLLSDGPHRSLGASGMVMGALGLITMQTGALWRLGGPSKKYFLSAICGGVLLFALLGLTPGTDVLAHFGGFVSGIVIGCILVFFSKTTRKPPLNPISGLIFMLLVIIPWWLALKHR